MTLVGCACSLVYDKSTTRNDGPGLEVPEHLKETVDSSTGNFCLRAKVIGSIFPLIPVLGYFLPKTGTVVQKRNVYWVNHDYKSLADISNRLLRITFTHVPRKLLFLLYFCSKIHSFIHPFWSQH